MSNTIFDKVKSTMNTAADSLSTIAQDFVEKNRTKAKLNRLRMVMKSESELMNRAYIALGKEYYETLKRGDAAAANEQQTNLLSVIDNSKAKIAKARECYREVLESQSEFVYTAARRPAKQAETHPAQEDVVDITVACSNEDDYSTSPFAAAADKLDEVRETVGEKAEAAAEKAEEIKEKAAAVKDALSESVGESKEHIARAVKEALDEEYPDNEPF